MGKEYMEDCGGVDRIWWEKVTNASGFLRHIVDTIQDGRSVILYLPEHVPWYATMRRILDVSIHRENSISALQDFRDNGDDPGESMLTLFCMPEKRAHYRSGIGYAAFLANSSDIVMNDSIVWVSDVSEAQLDCWIRFIEEYNRALGKHKRGCRFLVETHARSIRPEKRGMTNSVFDREIGRYDRFLFDMLAASEQRGSALFKQYLAETISILFPDDMELCAQCIRRGAAFLSDPLRVLRSIGDSGRRSSGEAYDSTLSEDAVSRCFWEAQIKIIFPIIEKRRSIYIEQYEDDISQWMPLLKEQGWKYTEASEVEVGALSYLIGSGHLHMPPADITQITKLKNARNTLAHLKVLSQKEVDEILAMSCPVAGDL